MTRTVWRATRPLYRVAASRSNTGERHGSERVAEPRAYAAAAAGRTSGRFTRLSMRVADDLRALERDEPAAPCPLDHRLQGRQRRSDLLLAVDDLDEDREVLREAEDL